MQIRMYKWVLILSSLISFQIWSVAQVSEESSFKEVIDQIIIKLDTDYIDTLSIELVNSHNGRYTVSSKVVRTKEGFEILTKSVTMTGSEKQIRFSLAKDKLRERLRYVSRERNLKFAGHYQEILLDDGVDEFRYNTRDALELIDVLEKKILTPSERQREQINQKTKRIE